MSDEESKFISHARRELALLGNGPEYDEKIVEMLSIFSSMGHSGTSAAYTAHVVSRLLLWENLTAITNSAEEWFYHGPEEWNGTTGIWQNKRNSAYFSTDEGRTYYSVNDPDKIIRTSATPK